MKALIVLAVTLFSVNSFAASVGVDAKGECKFGPQGGRKAEPKIVNDSSTEAPVEAKKAAGK